MKTARVWLIGLVVAGIVGALLVMDAALARAEPHGGQPFAPTDWISLVPFANGLNDPVGLASTGVVSDARLFVVQRAGLIRVVTGTGTVLGTPFLNLQSKVTGSQDQNAEVGLLGLAFSPDYANDGQFFVYYTDTSGDIQLSRFSVSGNPNVADPTETPLLNIPHPNHRNHNGGQLAFGPDGYLYLGPGDGGGGGDTDNNAQNLSLRLGKILRINVTGVATYTVPASNPFTQTVDAQPEIWALGFRNPWRFSFDRETGDLWVGDVGQDHWEEVDHQSAASTGGENYGWRCYEGTHIFNLSAGCPGPYVTPVTEYNHDEGERAITGGYVYRGSLYPSMLGYYLYADYGSGRFWALHAASLTVTPLLQLNDNPTSFGQDWTGELYVAGQSGKIYRVAGPEPPPPVETPYWLPVLTR